MHAPEIDSLVVCAIDHHGISSSRSLQNLQALDNMSRHASLWLMSLGVGLRWAARDVQCRGCCLNIPSIYERICVVVLIIICAR